MNMVSEFVKLDIPSIIMGIFIILSSVIAIFEVIGRFSKIIGKPAAWMQHREANVTALSHKVDALTDSIRELKEIQDKDKRSEYKDRIGECYRYYCERKYSDSKPVPYWNHMEKESLEGLIEQYEAHGGRNSFVHSVVEPEMQTWKVIE